MPIDFNPFLMVPVVFVVLNVKNPVVCFVTKFYIPISIMSASVLRILQLMMPTALTESILDRTY